MSDKSDRDNRSNQLNPNNQAYWSSRGLHVDDDSYGDEEATGPDWKFCERAREYAKPLTSSEPDLVFEIPPVFEVMVHYINEKGSMGAVIIESRCSYDEIVGAVRKLWDERKFFYLKAFAGSEILFLDERPLSLASLENRARLEGLLAVAKKYPKSDDDVPHPSFLWPGHCEVKKIFDHYAFR